MYLVANFRKNQMKHAIMVFTNKFKDRNQGRDLTKTNWIVPLFVTNPIKGNTFIRSNPLTKPYILMWRLVGIGLFKYSNIL